MCPTETASVVETVLLDEMLDGECGCEAIHHSSVCSTEVTHRITHCMAPHGKLCCTSAAKWTQKVIDLNVHCGACGDWVAGHWSVIPV